MVIVDENSPAIRMPIHPLAAFESSVHKAVAFQRPDQLPNRNVPQCLVWIPTDHNSANTGRQLQPDFSSYRQSN
jgi:hypothetical protein